MNKTVPQIAVLLAAYNGAKWLDEQVRSVLGQTAVNVTVFISVDQSGDGTEQLAGKLAEQESNIELLPCGQRFGGAASNFFRLIADVDITEYDAVSFADQDDIWFPDKLSRAWSLISSGQCDVVSSDVIAFWPDGRKQLVKKSYPQQRYDCYFEAAGPGCTYVFSLAAMTAFKGFLMDRARGGDGIELHDWLAYAFCRSRGFVWHIDPEPSMLYRQHDNNQVGTNSGLKAYSKRLSMVRNHWYRNQVQTITSLVNPKLVPKFSRYFYRLMHVGVMRRRPRDRAALLLMFIFGLY